MGMGKPIKFFKKFMLRKRVVKRPGSVPGKVASPLRKYMLTSGAGLHPEDARGGHGRGRGGGRGGGRRRGRYEAPSRVPTVRKLVKIYVRATFNNTFFALGSLQGNILTS